MSDVSNIIWETCKTYLWQQGKFLFVLWILIGACILYYFGNLAEKTGPDGKPMHYSAFEITVILAASVLGILGS
jgi:K(+)-stimulated pyrophosphate-energized sodium pump